MEGRPTCTFVWMGNGWLFPDQARDMIAAHRRGELPDLLIEYIDIEGNLIGTSEGPQIAMSPDIEELKNKN